MKLSKNRSSRGFHSGSKDFGKSYGKAVDEVLKMRLSPVNRTNPPFTDQFPQTPKQSAIVYDAEKNGIGGDYRHDKSKLYADAVKGGRKA